MYLFGRSKGTWVFSKLPGLKNYFPENFRCKLTFYESENFSDSSLHHILEAKNFRFSCGLFCTKNSLTWGEKCEKLDFRKSQKINYIRFKNCTWMECSSRNSKQFSSNKKFYAIFASLNKYYTENNRWVPLLIWD